MLKIKDKKIAQYINNQNDLQKNILYALREIIFKIIPDCREKMQWGVITFDQEKFYIVALKKKAHIGFAIKGLSKEEVKLFEGSGKTMRHIKIYSLEDINKKNIINLIKLVHKKAKCETK